MDIEERRQAVALFRYSLIRPLADPGLSARERGALVRALVELDHLGPDGRRVVGIESARAAARSKGAYLSERYLQVCRRRGDRKAIVAVGHEILIAA